MKKILNGLILSLILTTVASTNVFAATPDLTAKKIDVSTLSEKIKQSAKGDNVKFTKEEKAFILNSKKETQERVRQNMDELKTIFENRKMNIDETFNVDSNNIINTEAFSFQNKTPQNISYGYTTAIYWAPTVYDSWKKTSSLAMGEAIYLSLEDEMKFGYAALGNVSMGGNYSAGVQLGKLFKMNSTYSSQYADIIIKGYTKGKLYTLGDGDSDILLRSRVYDVTAGQYVKSSDSVFEENCGDSIISDNTYINRSYSPKINSVYLRVGHTYVVLVEVLTSGDAGILGKAGTDFTTSDYRLDIDTVQFTNWRR